MILLLLYSYYSLNNDQNRRFSVLLCLGFPNKNENALCYGIRIMLEKSN